LHTTTKIGEEINAEQDGQRELKAKFSTQRRKGAKAQRIFDANFSILMRSEISGKSAENS